MSKKFIVICMIRLNSSIRGGYRTFANRSEMAVMEMVLKFLKSHMLAIKCKLLQKVEEC
jgi:hypothetical protein